MIVAELLDTFMVWPLTSTDCRCASHPDWVFVRVIAAGDPCGMVTPLPTSAGFMTMPRYCFPGPSLPESTASRILTARAVPATGAAELAPADPFSAGTPPELAARTWAEL